MQAVTRVNVEQASKRAMWKPTRLNNGEGRRPWDIRAMSGSMGSTGVMTMACMKEESISKTGSLCGVAVNHNENSVRNRLGRMRWRRGP